MVFVVMLKEFFRESVLVGPTIRWEAYCHWIASSGESNPSGRESRRLCMCGSASSVNPGNVPTAIQSGAWTY